MLFESPSANKNAGIFVYKKKISRISRQQQQNIKTNAEPQGPVQLHRSHTREVPYINIARWYKLTLFALHLNHGLHILRIIYAFDNLFHRFLLDMKLLIYLATFSNSVILLLCEFSDTL